MCSARQPGASRTEACQRTRSTFLSFLRSFYDQSVSERSPGGAGEAGGAGSKVSASNRGLIEAALRLPNPGFDPVTLRSPETEAPLYEKLWPLPWPPDHREHNFTGHEQKKRPVSSENTSHAECGPKQLNLSSEARRCE
ncbi:hypothetical protein SKAU_G00219580 [Synaphobranchus kaupii]|uniref:Uncharacterized protein n=1 Tax=Synaphobranchus kaupii TaxID=118154 RepID=A0A9Q1IVR2_SYNKA|nr:hypothetical protein SKAU_G00219580 [Synaphobranchus kaupii]